MKDFTVKPVVTIRQAMKKLSKSGEKCLLIVGEKNILLGTLSDGDLRRAILKGAAVGDSIKNIFHQKPTVLIDGEYNLPEVKKLFTKLKLPIFQ